MAVRGICTRLVVSSGIGVAGIRYSLSEGTESRRCGEEGMELCSAWVLGFASSAPHSPWTSSSENVQCIPFASSDTAALKMSGRHKLTVL